MEDYKRYKVNASRVQYASFSPGEIMLGVVKTRAPILQAADLPYFWVSAPTEERARIAALAILDQDKILHKKGWRIELQLELDE